VADRDRSGAGRQVRLEVLHVHLERRHAGEHTIVSRATDRDGYVQPETLAEKKTFLEDNTQFPRKVMIA